MVDKPIDEVWTKAVPAIGKQFFVINNLDKSSGLMNLSYSGSPEQYVDCGHLNLQDQKASGVQTQSFPLRRPIGNIGCRAASRPSG
ncbi:hypothetical protein WJ968_09260 [Achromobacter xylosoxidans]